MAAHARSLFTHAHVTTIGGGCVGCERLLSGGETRGDRGTFLRHRSPYFAIWLTGCGRSRVRVHQSDFRVNIAFNKLKLHFFASHATPGGHRGKRSIDYVFVGRLRWKSMTSAWRLLRIRPIDKLAYTERGVWLYIGVHSLKVLTRYAKKQTPRRAIKMAVAPATRCWKIRAHSPTKRCLSSPPSSHLCTRWEIRVGSIATCFIVNSSRLKYFYSQLAC